MEALKGAEPLRVEVPVEVPSPVDLARQTEAFAQKFSRTWLGSTLRAAVFRVLYSNWALNKLARKVKRGGAEGGA